MNEYVIPKIANWEDAGGSASMRAFAKLGSIALTKSIDYLRDFLPFELESRYLATWFYQNPNPGSCATIVGGVSNDQEQIEGICRQFDFTQLDDIRMWYSAMYYGPNSEQYEGLRKMTGLSNIQMSDLFANNGPFGQRATNIKNEMGAHYNCDGNQCTEDEIAGIQFLTAGMTSNLIATYRDSEAGYLVENNTMGYDYGFYKEVPLEFSFFMDDEMTVSEKTWDNLYNEDVGLNHYDNMFRFARVVSPGTGDMSEYQELYDT